MTTIKVTLPFLIPFFTCIFLSFLFNTLFGGCSGIWTFIVLLDKVPFRTAKMNSIRVLQK